MDLGKCPRCGKEWPQGAEICPNCGFIPIGAGLRQLNLEQESQGRKQLPTFYGLPFDVKGQPGSWAGLLATTITLCGMAWAAQASPWTNDWEGLRVLTGDVPSPSVVGSWGIAKSESLDYRGSPGRVDGLSGTLQFGANGGLRFRFERGYQRMEATGSYQVRDGKILVKNMKGTNGDAPLPRRVNFSLVWRKGDQMVLDIEKQERLTLVLIK